MQSNLEFQTDRLILRALRNEDAEALRHAICSSAESIGPWLDWCHEGFDEMDAQAWINRSRQGWITSSSYELVAFEQDTNALVGCVYISSIDRVANMANLGYWIAQDYQGQQYAVEATEVAATIAFGHLLLTRLELVMDPKNSASIRIAEKLGATFECRARNRYMYDGEAREGLVYSLIPADIGF
ncbi:GNAT family N-acetyltransferase [Enterovibrio paralichthyis]|uniref:GNAT family N-acetyltransferase n=1 Tax=Enterovibrio paralichthyis TaxID=2853805 RepID=UPI001C4767D8|nr:GNAT family N-acetyltransferase [Enterovibrio paralichthyis]MBV7297068.1 GNAT family N-acetyltransferase [Enterovibrio paralichthyis]